MNHHPTRRRVVAVLVAVGALAGTGVTLARTGTPTPGTVAALHERLLQPGTLPGFASTVCPIVETDASRWAGADGSLAGLLRNGFVAGLRQPLYAASTDADGDTSVSQFASARGARRELADELATARAGSAGYTAFPVARIPGAVGFALANGIERQSVLFSDGRYLYRVTAATARERLLAATAALYRRVHGTPGVTSRQLRFLLR